MTQKMNRLASKQWAEERDRIQSEEEYRKTVMAKLEVIGPFRSFVLKNAGPDQMLSTIDDWVEELTGFRGWFHAQDCAHEKPPIVMPHERKKAAPLPKE